MQRKIFDCHMHTLSGAPENLQIIADHFGFDKYTVLGCPCFAGINNNLYVLLAKARCDQVVPHVSCTQRRKFVIVAGVTYIVGITQHYQLVTMYQYVFKDQLVYIILRLFVYPAVIKCEMYLESISVLTVPRYCNERQE